MKTSCMSNALVPLVKNGLAWLTAFAAAGCTGQTGTPPSQTASPIEVRVAQAEQKPLTTTFEAGGVIRAQTTAQVMSRIVAPVLEVRVRPGDRVKLGQAVVLLDNRDLAARNAQAGAALAAAQNGRISADASRDAADAALTLAKIHHARVQGLRDRNSATPAELDKATADLRAADGAARAAAARSAEAAAAVEAAEAAGRGAAVAASYSTITAPFDGLVTAKLTEPGNMASPGMPLLTIEAVDAFRLEFHADEARVRSLRPGDEVAVEVEGGGEATSMTGKVVEIAHAIDVAAHTFAVKVAIPPDPALRSGMFARARLRSDVRNVLNVPPEAIVRRGQLSLVFVVDDERRARLRAVTTGARADDAVEILAGLSQGERVVVAPPASLVDGLPVRVAGGKP
jgi:RND family efflux transporter MFP subunit